MQNNQKTTQPFLSFELETKQTALISLEQITEIVQIPLNQLCKIPQMHHSIVGIYNWRGEMLWIVDLEAMLLQSPNSLSKPIALILKHQDKYLGVLVKKIISIDSLNTSSIQTPSANMFYPEIQPFLLGYFLNDDSQVSLILDAVSIVESSLWSEHTS